MADKQTGTLISKWAADGVCWRLVAIGRWTNGYEDKYVIEKLELDALGAERWILWVEVNKSDEPAMVLVQGIKALAPFEQAARAQAERAVEQARVLRESR